MPSCLFFNLNLLIQKVIIKVTSFAIVIVFVGIEDSKFEKSSLQTHAEESNCSINYELYMHRDYILGCFLFYSYNS